MSTQPPHHVSIFGFRISQSLSRRAGDPSGRIMRNEPNSHIPGVPPPPVFAIRTQSTNPEPPTTNYLRETNPISRAPHPAHDQKMRNEPNFVPLATPKMQNEPNLHPANSRNEPNSCISSVPPPQKCETNPIHARQICETNPIYPPRARLHDPNSRNEANSRIPSVPQPPISAKRTQSTGMQKCETNPILVYQVSNHPAHTPYYAKRTQLPHTKCPAAPYFSETNPICWDAKMRNEPNLQSTIYNPIPQSHKAGFE